MATIGTFTLGKDGVYTGTIETLTLCKEARFVPNKDKKGDKSPDYWVYAGKEAEPGAAWHETSKDGETPYLSVLLHDPSFVRPLRAAFFENTVERTGILVWTPPSEKDR
ncbi:MAG: hypothetical protein B7X53_01145 [Hyphomonas sp. 34-62-18]|nr:DUF736 domain-containing protein [Hyphomonas sp. 34-62-18]OZB19108.1 MAG: hypothetical protein B7X53_01145 [Hyphomonas sp. 34-62-18]